MKKLTKSINSQFTPTYMAGVPMYGLGSFLKDTGMFMADNTLSLFGAQNVIQDKDYSGKAFAKASNIMSPISNVAGQVGASLLLPGVGSQIMGGVQQVAGSAVGDPEATVESEEAQRINSYNQALKTLAAGGFLDSIFTPYMCGGKMKAGGGPLDEVTIYQNGGTHETNPIGGVPIGNKGMVEEGEVRWKDYIFSNRF